MTVLIDIAYLIALIAISPVAIYKMLRYGRYRAGWENRFGKISRKRPDKKCIWIHAVSVGEVNATTTLIRELETKFPDYEIAISTTTDTGFARANALFGSRLSVFYFPMDFSLTMRRAFANIRPAMCLLIELEVWPNLVRIAKQSGIPVIVVNGRLSERSVRRYNLIKGVTRKIFGGLTLALAQSEEYAERFRQLGMPAEKVIVTGSVKYDTAQVTDKVDGAEVLAAQLGLKNCRLWVAGATGDNEEQIILDVYKRLVEQKQFADLHLAIVPRKPERFNDVAELIKQSGFELTRYSELKAATTKSAIDNQQSAISNVVLGDTMGDLRKFYSLAAVIFVGRSLVPMGGSDMMEAAALGKCTIFGPHAFNFKQAVDDLLKANGAILVKDPDELFDAMKKCLTDADYASQIAQNGRQIIRKNQGATARTISNISKMLK
ncbi:MAG: 3-deoxy-D-manno-octulosonic acid transferase [Sedimentisphaerales bacterium]|jgi:3-deoxy-D-manno-octulosonic-acid transferase